MTHPKDMTREELIALVGDLSWQALDLAQHLSFTNELLKPEYQLKAYQKACWMAYYLSTYAYEDDMQIPSGRASIAIFGEDGLETLTARLT